MLFRIIQMGRQAKQGVKDPQGFLSEQAKGAIIEAILIPVIGLVLFLVFLFLLSYTHLLGGPYGVARFFFWFLTVVYIMAGYFSYALYSTVKKALSKNKKKQSEESFSADGHRIREAEIVKE